MMKIPKDSLLVVDTNVPLVANLRHRPDPESDVPESCVTACIDVIEQVKRQKTLVLDEDGEIFEEYAHKLAERRRKGQPGHGDLFFKWVHDHRFTLPDEQRVRITKTGASYREFPAHKDLRAFDRSDRKFVAVANAHPDKPPIVQAADSKWWGWKDALEASGLRVCFVCEDYVKAKYAKKMRR